MQLLSVYPVLILKCKLVLVLDLSLDWRCSVSDLEIGCPRRALLEPSRGVLVSLFNFLFEDLFFNALWNLLNLRRKGLIACSLLVVVKVKTDSLALCFNRTHHSVIASSGILISRFGPRLGLNSGLSCNRSLGRRDSAVSNLHESTRLLSSCNCGCSTALELSFDGSSTLRRRSVVVLTICHTRLTNERLRLGGLLDVLEC